METENGTSMHVTSLRKVQIEKIKIPLYSDCIAGFFYIKVNRLSSTKRFLLGFPSQR